MMPIASLSLAATCRVVACDTSGQLSDMPAVNDAVS